MTLSFRKLASSDGTLADADAGESRSLRGRWLDADRGLLAGILEQKLSVVARGRGRTQLAEILHWIELLNDECAPCAVAVAHRLEQLLSHLDSGGFARWILSGLRLYGGDPKRLGAYFRLEDARAVEALHGESAADDLAESIPSLTLLLKGLSSRDVILQPRKQAVLNAPPLRPILTGRHLLLPDGYTTLDGVDRYRIYRAAVAHACAHLLYSVPGRAVAALKPLGVAVVSAIEDARVERLLVKGLPGVRGWFLEFLAKDIDPSSLDFSSLIARMSRALLDDRYEDGNYWVNKARELFGSEERSSGLADYDAFRKLASILANDLGQMRVRFNPQQYAVPAVYRDDNSFLWDFGDPQTPPSESQELHVTGVALEYRPADASQGDSSANEPRMAQEEPLARCTYPEWDYRIQLRRRDWCTVVEKRPVWRASHALIRGERDAAAAPLVPLVRSRRLSRSRRIRRQWEGEDIDLNAAIEVLVERRLNLAPDGRLFMRPGSEERVSSILVLLDLSESANDRIAGSMRSILDVEKQAALILAQASLQGRDRIAIHGFSSNTRSEVNYFRLLDFGAAFDAASANVIQSVQADYSTRMGAALRHAVSFLSQEPADQRAIVVVTDGAPSDVDVFDAGYLVEDARVAVQEAQRAAVRCLCVAVDPQADSYVKKIFGWRNYRIVEDPETLPKHLSDLYSRLTAR